MLSWLARHGKVSGLQPLKKPRNSQRPIGTQHNLQRRHAASGRRDHRTSGKCIPVWPERSGLDKSDLVSDTWRRTISLHPNLHQRTNPSTTHTQRPGGEEYLERRTFLKTLSARNRTENETVDTTVRMKAAMDRVAGGFTPKKN